MSSSIAARLARASLSRTTSTSASASMTMAMSMKRRGSVRCFSGDAHHRRAFNFSAGPSCLPTSVMMRAQAEFLDYAGSGMGIMEMSHRDAGGPVQNSIIEATASLRRLLAVPDNYHVLFFQGGAHAQFAAVPLNLAADANQTGDYLLSGYWSQRAHDEGAKYVKTNVIADCADNEYRRMPHPSEWNLTEGASFVHLCANETIHGIEILREPEDYQGAAPLVIDMTSTLMSRPVDVSKYGVIFASSGKNLGPAGLCVVIVRDDLIGHARAETPSVLDYHKMATSQPIPSIYNTPPTFITYMTNLVLQDIEQRGGLEAMEERAVRLSGLLYGIIDASDGFYSNHVDEEWRSRMNVPFRIDGGNRELETLFTQQAEQSGLLQVFGHPLFGGQRITLYNSVPDEAVDAIAAFMDRFMQQHR